MNPGTTAESSELGGGGLFVWCVPQLRLSKRGGGGEAVGASAGTSNICGATYMYVPLLHF